MTIPTFLEKQILATIVYYDILDYPLTNFEVFLYLIEGDKNEKDRNEANYKVSNLNYFLSLLDNSEYLNNNLDQNLGFYFLQNRQEIVQKRLNRKKIVDKKWKKAKKIFWIMQIIPFTELVMASGSFALGNTRKDSDIDLIIVAQKGRIWMVRTFFTLLTIILRVRRHQNQTEDKICLNHYITNHSLNIPFESLYNATSYNHILSVYNCKNDRKMFLKFQKENKWIRNYIKNYKFSEIESFRSIKRSWFLSTIAQFFKFFLVGKVGDFIENKLGVIQTRRIQKNPICKKSGGRITVSDEQLEFHPDSHESYIIPEFNRRMESLELFEFAHQKDSGLNV